MSAKNLQIEILPDTILSPEEDVAIRAEIEQAEADFAVPNAEVRVNFRWGQEQLETVKVAAAAIGVPYQDYIKLAVWRAAAADLETAVQVRSIRRALASAGH